MWEQEGMGVISVPVQDGSLFLSGILHYYVLCVGMMKMLMMMMM